MLTDDDMEDSFEEDLEFANEPGLLGDVELAAVVRRLPSRADEGNL